MKKLIFPAVVLSLLLAPSAMKAAEPYAQWFAFLAGQWEVKGGVDPDGIGTHVAELTAGGRSLLTRGTSGLGVKFVRLEGWESVSNSIVATTFLANGAYGRLTYDKIEPNRIAGRIEGADENGEPFSGKVSVKKTGDNTALTIYTGTLAGETVELRWIGTRKK